MERYSIKWSRKSFPAKEITYPQFEDLTYIEPAFCNLFNMKLLNG
jgi:hypothetical protein